MTFVAHLELGKNLARIGEILVDGAGEERAGEEIVEVNDEEHVHEDVEEHYHPTEWAYFGAYWTSVSEVFRKVRLH